MAFINSDGTEAVKDMGQLGIEADGSAMGVQAISLKEGLGRRANRLGGGAQADSTGSPVTINTSGVTQLCQVAAPGAGNRHHAIMISLCVLGGTVGTDWVFFSIQWNQDDGAKHHIVYVPANGYMNLVLDGQLCAAQNGMITVSAQAGTAGVTKAMASVCTVVLPN
jgi:hypothetical protein